jgi:hypothetical protein
MSVKNTSLYRHFFKKFLYLVIVLYTAQTCQASSPAIPVKYLHALIDRYPEDTSLACFTDSKSQLIGYKDKKGRIVIPAQFKVATPFNKFGLADVWLGRQGDDWYKLHKSGKVLVKSFYFDNGGDYFQSGLSRFEENGKIGFIDKTGKIRIAPKFDWAGIFDFTAPIATVCEGCKEVPMEGKAGELGMKEIKGGKWGMINRQGKVVIPMEYNEMETLGINDDAKPMLVKGDKYYLVIKTGNTYKVKEVQVEKGEDKRWKLKA